jgi:hypothetical protein
MADSGGVSVRHQFWGSGGRRTACLGQRYRGEVYAISLAAVAARRTTGLGLRCRGEVYAINFVALAA